MPIHRHVPSLLTLAIVLVGVGVLSFANMGPNDDRVLHYQGVLESNGNAPTQPHDFRFALFASSPSAVDLDCLLADPSPNCSLWSEQLDDVDVTSGRFAVTLGASTALTDNILGQPALYVGVAVRASGTSTFSKLNGTSRIVPSPLASRAAAAVDFKVTGTLTATTVSSTTVDADDVVTDSLDVGGNGAVIDSYLVVQRPNVARGTPAAVFKTNDNAHQLEVLTDGLRMTSADDLYLTPGSGRIVRSNGSHHVGGDLTTSGRLRADCPGGMTRLHPNSAVCIDDVVTNMGQNWYAAARICHANHKRMCTSSEIWVGLSYDNTDSFGFFSTGNRWAWSSAVVDTNGGTDHGGCHVNLNDDEPGKHLGESNCQVAAQAEDPNIGVLCCYSQ